MKTLGLFFLENSPVNNTSNFTNQSVSARFSVLCTPLFNQTNPVIDTIFAQTESLIRRSRLVLLSEATIDQLCSLQKDAERLQNGYAAWPASLSKEWAPEAVYQLAAKSDDIM